MNHCNVLLLWCPRRLQQGSLVRRTIGERQKHKRAFECLSPYRVWCFHFYRWSEYDVGNFPTGQSVVHWIQINTLVGALPLWNIYFHENNPVNPIYSKTALDSLVLCLCSSFSTWCMKYKFRHTEWSFSTWLYSQQFCCTLTTKCEPNLQFEITLKQRIEYEFSRITRYEHPPPPLPSFITMTIRCYVPPEHI